MKKLTKILALTMALGVSLSGLGACGDDGIDETKTQLRIYNYPGGFGTQWLKDIVTDFQNANENYQGKDGRVGVQVILDDETKTLGSAFKNNMGNTDIYFTEDVRYYDMIKHGNDSLILDLTTAVTTDLTEYGEDRSIFDKLDATQQNYYKTADNKIYGIPYRMDAQGIIYDVSLFDEEELYFAKGGAPSEYCQFTQANNDDAVSGSFGDYEYTNLDGDRSAGPDGLYGTEDDGLPATYEEFFVLCDYMASAEKGIVPFNWNGYDKTYLTNFFQQLLIDYEGKAGYQIYLDYEGTAKNLIESVDEDGNVTFKEPTVISKASKNGYLMSSSAGRYYALKFFEKLIGTPEYYVSGGFNMVHTHMKAQKTFLESIEDGPRNAFLIDGVWWENEAYQTFDDMVSDYDNTDYSRLNRKFKMMQLPKATVADIGESATYGDNLYDLCFVNANIDADKIDLAKDFIRFCFTDENNIRFNLTTGLPRPMSYELDDDQLAQLSMFGKSVYDISKNGSLVYTFSNNDIYRMYNSNIDANITFGGKFVMQGATIADSFKYHGVNDFGVVTQSAKIIFDNSSDALRETLDGLWS